MQGPQNVKMYKNVINGSDQGRRSPGHWRDPKRKSFL